MNRKTKKIRLTRRGIAVVTIAVLLLVFSLTAVIYLQNRPATLAIKTIPPDASISIPDLTRTVGRLRLTGLRPGAYQVEVKRQGFKRHEAKLQIKSGEDIKETITLRPLPVHLALITFPPQAVLQLKRDEKILLDQAEIPFGDRISAGRLEISISKDGYNTLGQELFLDRDTTLTLWLDKKGQLLHCLNFFLCGPAPKGVAFRPDSREVWVTLLSHRPAIEIYDYMSGEKKAGIELGETGAVEILFSPDGQKAYATQMQTAKVYEIDVSTRQVLRVLDTKSAWSKVAEFSADGQTLFVSNWSGNDVSEIDLVTGKLRRRIPVVKTPRGLFAAPDGRSLYVAGFDGGEIERIDLDDVSRHLIFKSGGSIRHFAFDKTKGLLYASDLSKDCIWRMDLKTEMVDRFAVTDHKPNTIDLSPDGKLLFVSCRGANNPKSYYLPGPEWGSVLVFDTTTGSALDAVIGGNQCTALDISPDGRLLVFSDFLDNKLRIYSVPAYDVLIAGNGGRYQDHWKELKKPLSSKNVATPTKKAGPDKTE